MHRISPLFAESVLSLLDVSIFARCYCDDLDCRTWQRESYRISKHCTLSIHPEGEGNYEVDRILFQFSNNGEERGIDDFDRKNVLVSVVLSSADFGGRGENLFQATVDDAFLHRLKRNLAGRSCGSFDCYLDPKIHGNLMARLLPAMPLTFQSFAFDHGSEEAEKFLLETSKNQQIERLRMDGTWPKCPELKTLLDRILFDPATHGLYVGADSCIPFSTEAIESLIECWVDDPQRFTWDVVQFKVPIDFDFDLLSKQVKFTRSLGNDMDCFSRRLPGGCNTLNVIHFKVDRAIHLAFIRPRSPIFDFAMTINKDFITDEHIF